MKKAIYAGTFDPFTNGHQDIVERSLTIFDEVIILVASSNKKTLFTSEERVRMIEEVFKKQSKVSVDHWGGLLVKYASDNGIGYLVRGLRPTGDFEYEFQMASMNHELDKSLETVFFMSSSNKHYISSSLIKEVCRHNGDVSSFVPTHVSQELTKRFLS